MGGYLSRPITLKLISTELWPFLTREAQHCPGSKTENGRARSSTNSLWKVNLWRFGCVDIVPVRYNRISFESNLVLVVIIIGVWPCLWHYWINEDNISTCTPNHSQKCSSSQRGYNMKIVVGGTCITTTEGNLLEISYS
jgi:hypothetical protein